MSHVSTLAAPNPTTSTSSTNAVRFGIGSRASYSVNAYAARIETAHWPTSMREITPEA